MATKAKPKPKATDSAADSASQITQIDAEFAKLDKGVGTLGTPATGSVTPQTLGISAADSVLPVTFSLPHATTALTAKGGVPGAQRQPNGSVVTTYAGAVQALYLMDSAEHEEAQRQLIDAGYLSSSHPIDGSVDTATLDAWKRMALDAANGNVPISTLLAAQGAAPAVLAASKAAKSALQNAETNYAEVKTGTASLTDPNSIRQALSAAYASIGEAPPSAALQNSFVQAFQSAQISAAASPLEQEKAQEGQDIKRLEGAANDVQQGNLQAGANALQPQAGPIDVGTKSTPNLDADTMAQAKAADPAQYYATQSSYLYGLLLNDIRGTPAYQTSPTAPSETAPGGPITGTPLVPTGAANG